MKTLYFSILLISNSVLAGHGELNGGNECDGKLRVAKPLALAMYSQAKENLFNAKMQKPEVQKFFKDNRAKMMASLAAATIKSADTLPKRSPTDTHLHMQAFPSEKLVKVLESHCLDRTPSDLAYTLVHEAGHLADFGDDFEEILWDVANGVVSSLVTPVSKEGSNTQKGERLGFDEISRAIDLTAKLTELTPPMTAEKPFNIEDSIASLDPVYAKFLLPGRFPHAKVTAAIDEMAPFREQVRKRFIETLKNMPVDERGIYQIPVWTGESFRSYSGTEVSKESTYGDFGQAYVRALSQALSPITGIQVASVGNKHVEYMHATDHLVRTTSLSIGASFFSVEIAA